MMKHADKKKKQKDKEKHFKLDKKNNGKFN